MAGHEGRDLSNDLLLAIQELSAVQKQIVSALANLEQRFGEQDRARLANLEQRFDEQDRIKAQQSADLQAIVAKISAHRIDWAFYVLIFMLLAGNIFVNLRCQ